MAWFVGGHGPLVLVSAGLCVRGVQCIPEKWLDRTAGRDPADMDAPIVDARVICGARNNGFGRQEPKVRIGDEFGRKT